MEKKGKDTHECIDPAQIGLVKINQTHDGIPVQSNLILFISLFLVNF